jgi:hypothetical protein
MLLSHPDELIPSSPQKDYASGAASHILVAVLSVFAATPPTWSLASWLMGLIVDTVGLLCKCGGSCYHGCPVWRCSDSTHMEPEREETLGYSHKVIGIIAFAFLMLQVCTCQGALHCQLQSHCCMTACMQSMECGWALLHCREEAVHCCRVWLAACRSAHCTWHGL